MSSGPSDGTAAAILIVLLAIAQMRNLQPQFIASTLTVLAAVAAWWKLCRKRIR